MGLWAYFYLAFAFRLLRQVPLHLGFASYNDLGLNYWHFNNYELRKNDHQHNDDDYFAKKSINQVHSNHPK